MWKDFFYFTKGQRIGVASFIVLIIIAVALNFLFPLFFPATDTLDNAHFEQEVQEFKNSLIARDSLKKLERERWYAERKNQYRKYENTDEKTYTLFSFDPNAADSLSFIRLGLSSGVTSNILKFRLKGGRFRKTSDFSKIYGLSENKFNELKSYINIQFSEEKTEKDVFKSDPALEPDTAFLLVDLNSADTAELMKVPGIGPYYAKEIVRYRNISGGFVSVNQLLEIKNLRRENFEKILPHCAVDTAKVKKINVNHASMDFLNRHPYINFYQAKVIYEYRRAKGKLDDIDELLRFDEFSEKDISRLKPYFSFE